MDVVCGFGIVQGACWLGARWCAAKHGRGACPWPCPQLTAQPSPAARQRPASPKPTLWLPLLMSVAVVPMDLSEVSASIVRSCPLPAVVEGVVGLPLGVAVGLEQWDHWLAWGAAAVRGLRWDAP